MKVNPPAHTHGLVSIRGAAENNLRDVDVDLPHRQLVAISGVSGSGKSSLVFDTLYAESRRRFLSAMGNPRKSASMALSWIRRPRVRRIDGLAPALATDQSRAGGNNPRSTAAIVARLYDYVRVLFARVGQPHCVGCGALVQSHRFEELFETAAGMPVGTRLIILAPLPFHLHHGDSGVLQVVERSGYSRLRIGADTHAIEDIDEEMLDAAGVVEIVVDRLVVKEEAMGRLRGSLEAAVEVGEGRVGLWEPDSEPRHFAIRPTCSECGRPFKQITPSLFSFNSVHGACSQCRGLGTRSGASLGMLSDEDSVAEALSPLWDLFGHHDFHSRLKAFAVRQGVDLEEPVNKWPPDKVAMLRGGEKGKGRDRFKGLSHWLSMTGAKAQDTELEWLEERSTDVACDYCGGTRLNSEALSVEVGSHNIASFLALTIEEAGAFARDVEFERSLAVVAAPLLQQILGRVGVLCDLGLGYLSLDRGAHTLSSGEFQRLRLAGGLGSGLTQVLYLLDEPSAGLHARDAVRLGRALRELTEAGNTAVFVEHDPALIRQADYVVDLGPGAGAEGGHVVAAGAPEELACGESPTAKHLSQSFSWKHMAKGRRPSHEVLRIEDASGNNLKGITVDIPLGLFVCVTGVSGSGKSTLVQDTLYPAVAARLQGGQRRPLAHKAISGEQHLERIIAVDQRPIGRSSRSNAATYTGILTELRRIYAEVPDARMRGYRPSHFSFNAPEGACPLCHGIGLAGGNGFSDDMKIPCSNCGGRRYNAEVLQIRYRDLSIADVLDMTVAESLQQFGAIPGVARRLQLLADLGLGYLHLRQSGLHLSGGEAQRIKLATELSRSQQERTLYILDEPTSGLHLDDVGYLVELLQRLVDHNNSVLVVEHCLELIAVADFVIDIGPEAGDGGGQIVAAAPPNRVAEHEESWTGRFLKQIGRGDENINRAEAT